MLSIPIAGLCNGGAQQDAPATGPEPTPAARTTWTGVLITRRGERLRSTALRVRVPARTGSFRKGKKASSRFEEVRLKTVKNVKTTGRIARTKRRPVCCRGGNNPLLHRRPKQRGHAISAVRQPPNAVCWQTRADEAGGQGLLQKSLAPSRELSVAAKSFPGRPPPAG